MPDSEQQPKVAPPAINLYVGRILKAYASGLIRHAVLPPFVHDQEVMNAKAPSPLLKCLNLVKVCSGTAADFHAMASQLLEQDMAIIFELRATLDHRAMLGAFQAYLIYVTTLYFVLGQRDNSLLRQHMMNLQQLAFDTCSRGLVCTAELEHIRPQYSDWIVAESTRRTLYTMYLLDNLLCTNDNLPVYIGTELAGLPAPAGQDVWRASSEDKWKSAYNTHLSDWNGSSLSIDELWRVAEDAPEEAIERRRTRIDLWLETVDEYGTFLYAVTSCTHGE
jgi:hypothetical protein